MTLPAFPSFQAVGTSQSGTGALTVAWPTHQTDDVALLVVVSQNETNSLSTPAGFVEVTGSPQSQGSAVRLSIFWCRATSAAMTSPVVGAQTLNRYAVIYTFRNCVRTGNPWDVTTTGTNGSGTSPSWATGTGNWRRELVVGVIGHVVLSSSAQMSGYTNASLANITERGDESTTLGGGAALFTGELASGGASGATTATLANTSNYALISLLLRPRWSVDSTSGIGFPQNLTEWTDIIADCGLTISTPDSLHLLQETTTALGFADSINGFTMSAVGTVAVAQSVTGFNVKAIKFTDGTSGSALNQSASLPDLQSQSMAMLTYTIINSGPAANRDFMELGSGGRWRVRVNSTPRWQIVNGSTATSAASPVGTVRPYMVVINAATPSTVAYADNDSRTATYAADTTSTRIYRIGGSSGASNPPDASVLYEVSWHLSKAEAMTSRAMRELYTALGWSPTFAIQATATIAESASAPTDSVARAFSGARGVSDNVTAPTDACARAATFPRGPTDSCDAPTDSVARRFDGSRSVEDLVDAATDAVERVLALARSVPEDVDAPTDDVARQVEFVRASDETTTTTDDVARQFDGTRDVDDDVVAVTDDVSRSLAVIRSTDETIDAVTDDVARTAQLYRSPTETLPGSTAPTVVTPIFVFDD